MVLYALTIFISAFLLFQVQPIIARVILPWFGGTAAVWTTCMLFFQTALVAGYLYAHKVRRLSLRAQVSLHCALISASTLTLPLAPSISWRPTGSEDPIPRILALLATSVGLPYLLLSTTGPLLQSWYVRARASAVPYRLFALSNLASMLALLSYPFLIEPLLSTRWQALSWSGGYWLFALLCGSTAIYTLRHATAKIPQAADQGWGDGSSSEAPARGYYVMWLLLSACASMLLLSVTNYLCQDIASVPFLWIAPLSLYLLTFILCFDGRDWYHRRLFLGLLTPSLAAMTYFLWGAVEQPDLKLIIPLLLLAFFVCCMFCHGELVRLKPPARYLTSFYLMIALGGALGGVFVGLMAPLVFRGYFEFHTALALSVILAAVLLHRDESRADGWHWKPISTGVVMPAAVLLTFVFVVAEEHVKDYRYVGRNFYGLLRVRQTGEAHEEDAYRFLLHGSITHGEQWLNPQLRRKPTTYYCAESGVAQALQLTAYAGPRRIGVVGLGTGTLAAYGRPGDVMRIYEINPLVVEVAKKEFTYLSDSRASIEVVLGDARQSMEREPPQSYNVLAVDAFSSDSIPVHLLTREAMLLYFRHLAQDGILALHVSNRFLDLIPVVGAAARDLGKAAVVVDTDDSKDGECYGTTWVLLASDYSRITSLPFHNGAPLLSRPDAPLWTDDYSNLFRIIK
ncbi:MAG: fused MFS/spermidine synthase [Bryobacteraceae bacterium]|nr:fused MFS/spermidine synthase [Bryobacteraceae bacterium]